jgi:thymidylate kinase
MIDPAEREIANSSTPLKPQSVLVAFDGPDGSGKSLAAHLVCQTYTSLEPGVRPNPTVQGRMPGGTPLGAAIRKVFKDPSMKIDPLNERLMMVVDSRQYMLDVVAKVQEEGKILVSDRWSPFTDYCYGLPRGLDANLLRSLQPMVPQIKLDILFLVMASQATIEARVKNDPDRIKNPCRLEADLKYQLAVHRLYGAAADIIDKTTENERLVYQRAREVAHEVVILFTDDRTPQDTARAARQYIDAVENRKNLLAATAPK